MNDKVKALALSMKTTYEEDVSNQKNFNALVYGHVGSGKTTLISTGRKPILIHSFDSHGTKTRALKPLIDSGDLLIKRFEREDMKAPSLAREWQDHFNELYSSGFFEAIGTYAIDSLTGLYPALMNGVMKSSTAYRQKDGWIPTMNAYGAIQPILRDLVQKVLELPCDVIITCHPTITKDEITGERETGLMIPGGMAGIIPTMFMEKWVMRTIKQGINQEAKFALQVHSDGTYNAETRIGGDLLQIFEEPNIKDLLKKVGLNAEDKPSLFN